MYAGDKAIHYAQQMKAELAVFQETLPSFVQAAVEAFGATTRLPLLDLGCGTGDMLQIVHGLDAAFPLVGVELSADMAVQARLACPGAEVKVGDARDLSGLTDRSVGGVICSFVCHFWEPTELAAAVLEWARVLAPAAPLYVGFWEGEGVMEGLPDGVVAYKCPKATMTDLLAKSGFETVSSRRTEYDWGDAGEYLVCVRGPGNHLG
jgi:SAM-dependent methyltransferase